MIFVVFIHLSVPVVDSESHAGRHEQKQRFLFTQFFPETIKDFTTFTHSLNTQQKGWKIKTRNMRHIASNKVVCSMCPIRSLSTFSLCISFFIWEILTFRASISSSGIWGIGEDSDSSMDWKVRSASGIYHLQSYCCPFLNTVRDTNQKLTMQTD